MNGLDNGKSQLELRIVPPSAELSHHAKKGSRDIAGNLLDEGLLDRSSRDRTLSRYAARQVDPALKPATENLYDSPQPE